MVKLLKKLAKPAIVSDGVSDNVVFCFYTGARHRGLTFGGPRDQVVIEIYVVSRRRLPSFGTPDPISVRISCEGCRRHHVELKTAVEHALDVAKNPFDQLKMRGARSMDVEAYLLNGIGDVWERQGEVLDHPGKASVICWVGYKITVRGREFRASVHRSGERIAVCHASTLKYLLSILALT